MSFLLPISPVSTGKGRRRRQTNESRGETIVTGGERKALPEAQSAERKQLKVTVRQRQGCCPVGISAGSADVLLSISSPSSHPWPLLADHLGRLFCFPRLLSANCRQQSLPIFVRGRHSHEQNRGALCHYCFMPEPQMQILLHSLLPPLCFQRP